MNRIVFLSFFLPCVSAFLPNGHPAIKVVTPSTFQLPATASTEVLDAPLIPADAVVPPMPAQSQIVQDAIASRTAMDANQQFMPAQVQEYQPAQAQEYQPAQAQAAAAVEPKPFYQDPVFFGASIAGFFASMFGAAGLVLQRRKSNARAERLAVNAAAAALALAGATAGATPAFAGNASNGEQIFSGNCAACHAGGNNVIQAEKTLKKDALVEYLAGGFKEESIVYQVTNGKNAMPAFGGRLSDEEIADVAAYVYKTSNADSWE